jgi:TonB family protein
VEGTVRIGLVVGTDGLPRDLKVLASLDKDLDKKALEAVQQRRYDPALKDGQPVERPSEVSIYFHVFHQ